jgi:undecaprenyl-diphosphatase
VTILQAVALGAVQGVTEFLPVSSSGHLVLLQKVFGITEGGLFFDTLLHGGTLLAVLVAMRSQIWALLKRPLQRYTLMLVLATIPTAALALAFGGIIEALFETGALLGAGFLVTAAALLAAEKLAEARGGVSGGRVETGINSNAAGAESTEGGSTKITPVRAVVVGVLQGLAIAPGVSRSGLTLAGTLASGIGREEAARFSFLLSIPVILGALALQVKDAAGASGASGAGALTAQACIAGFAASALVGFAAVSFMLRLVRKRRLYGFAVYTALLGLAVIADGLLFNIVF